MNETRHSHDDRIARLRDAIEKIARGEAHRDSQIVDREFEQALAPVAAKATRLINHRARSEHELRTRLLEEDFAAELVEEAISRCQNNGMLDDEQFASEWVRQRSQHCKKSTSVLRQELQRKGVQAGLIEQALETIDEDQQKEIMRQLIDKRARSVKRRPTDWKQYRSELRRLMGVAARRGFPEVEAKEYAEIALNRRIEEL
ncbi:regulatory protein RecX [Corynebacterium auriscanis]|uniref:Regulatory protein RecX n=1 Tax=Corynebacterium auriscanis TaxID=99807 RepID=A0A0A2DND7_9CORY|nr:regulatory protein RecX [Corynebacterium auriscanis]KGM19414.1 recombinase RecX [Corynebacterium auriscanis]MCX2162993.1 recombination regulator RecX [Corynebacterium auriscanis]WJY72854.1 Regulatory protein RecX [Corynebacterium auriscanis]